MDMPQDSEEQEQVQDHEESTIADASSTAQSPGLSKNAQKKLAKAARFAEQKKERRAAEKERRKQKRRLEAQKRDAEEAVEDEGTESGRRKKRKVEEQKGPRVPFDARIVVDLGFDHLMTDNVRSLTLILLLSTNSLMT